MAKKAIAFNVFVSNDYKDEDQKKQTFYTKIGAAFNVEKGGISVALNALPIDGNLVLFPPKEKE